MEWTSGDSFNKFRDVVDEGGVSNTSYPGFFLSPFFYFSLDRDVVTVLMEATPRDVDYNKLKFDLEHITGGGWEKKEKEQYYLDKRLY